MGDIKAIRQFDTILQKVIHCMMLSVGTDHKSQAVIFLKGVILILNWNKILLNVCPQKPNAEVSFKKTFQRERNAIMDVKKNTWQFLSLQDQLYRNQNTLAATAKILWACSWEVVHSEAHLPYFMCHCDNSFYLYMCSQQWTSAVRT